MKKQDLLNELSTKFHKLGRVAPVDLSPTDTTIRDEEGVRWYIAGIYEKADNRLIRKNIPFYVEAEGEVNEAAFYAEKLPAETLSTPTATPFKDLAIAEIEKKITAGIILKGVVREKVGVIEVEYNKNSPQAKRYPAIDFMLRPFLKSGGGANVELVRC